MARIASISRICNQQQSTFSNKGIPIHSKLWKGVENGGDIKKKGKVEKTMEFVERMKKMQEEAGAALKKAQEDMKRQVDRERKESKE